MRAFWRRSAWRTRHVYGRRPGRFRTLRRALLTALGAAFAFAALVVAGLGFLLYRHAHPPRLALADTPDSVFTRYSEASFASLDGIPLNGWWIAGKQGGPVVILCHDLGEARSSLLGLGAMLFEEGYSVLLFDFRGHGRSGGTSSFGTLEKRDVLGAIDWVSGRHGVDGGRIGLVGVGMGAHAAVLAGNERMQVRCLVLDSPYSDVSAEFAAGRLREGVLTRWLRRGSSFLYDVIYKVRSSEESAARRARGLNDRDLLFLAPRGRPAVVAATRAMYESVSESRDHDKNLIVLEGTRTTILYGEDRSRYDATILSFFRTYLPVAPPARRPLSGGPTAQRSRVPAAH